MDNLQKKQETGLAPVSRRGLEEPIQNEDLIIPRLMLIQNTPPKSVTIDKKICTPGTLINSLTVLPIALDEKGGAPFIPILRGVKWIRFNAQDADKPGYDPSYELGAKMWESRNPADPRVKEQGAWGPDNKAPLATKFIEFLCLVDGESMPLVIGFAKTSFAAGKQLTSMAQFSNKDLFARKYRLRSKEQTNDRKQNFYSLAVELIGDASEEEFKRAEEMYTSFSNREYKVHGEEDEAVPAPSERQPWES